MNPLIYFAAVGSASAGFVFWQQASIDRVHQDIARLSGDLVAVREAIETDRALVSEASAQLKQLRAARDEQAMTAAAQASALTPERQGWWPKDQPYFYLPKNYLSQVYFRSLRLPIEEVNAELTKRANAEDPRVTKVSQDPDADGKGKLGFRLFEAGKLNRDMALMLGMTDAEAERTDQLYVGLNRAVREIEAKRVERVDPPESDGDGSGRFIVARMPELSEEIKPLLAALNDELKQLLGESRAGVLESQAKDFFDQHKSKLGTVPLEFIKDTKNHNRLSINYRGERWGKHYAKTIDPIFSRDSEYGHLFGPGAPCELK